ncbi:tungsten ABC transporter permease [Derxia gummosa]|uniref:Tungsten ABC transporter permease n=1 Tax=Derxia gummosa DSM 723 TaxID=1121388 RepID=A0A8B6XDE9_9BURK|nr:tungsten ABC transporter permease [Derxia gummosa]
MDKTRFDPSRRRWLARGAAGLGLALGANARAAADSATALPAGAGPALAPTAAGLPGPAPVSASPVGPAPAALPVAVVGGLVMADLWPPLADAASAATGIATRLVASAPKEGVMPAFVSGAATLLLMHGGDEAFGLATRGFALPPRVWAQNEHVLVGPAADPAGIAGARDGAEAIARIRAADAPMLLFRDPGGFGIVQALWRAAGLRPGPRQQLYDDSEQPQQVLRSAARQGAYVLVGRLPVLFGRMPDAGLKILLQGDPAMRRSYVAIEPGPAHPADAGARAAAKAVADWLVSAAGQARIAALPARDGLPLLYPLPVSST